MYISPHGINLSAYPDPKCGVASSVVTLPRIRHPFSYPREISHSIDHSSSADATSVNGWSERGLATAVWVTPLSQAVYKIKRRMEPDVFVGHPADLFWKGVEGADSSRWG